MRCMQRALLLLKQTKGVRHLQPMKAIAPPLFHSLAVVATRRKGHDIGHDVDFACDPKLPRAGGRWVAGVLVGQLDQEARPDNTIHVNQI